MADNQQQVKKTPPTTVPPPGDTQTQFVPAELTKAIEDLAQQIEEAKKKSKEEVDNTSGQA